MKILLILAALLAVPVAVQAQGSTTATPDCQISLSAAAATTSVVYHNTKSCTFWTLAYNSAGFSAVSIEPEYAPDGATSNVAGTFLVWPSNQLASGSLPLTVATESQISTFGYHPWVRINFISKTGSGLIVATLNGWRTAAGDASSSGGSAVTCAACATSAKQDTGNTSLSSIDGKMVDGHGTAAAALRVELPTDGTGVVGLNAGSATIGTVKITATNGDTIQALANPCSTNSLSSVPIAFSVTTAAASSTVVAAVNAQKVYICDYEINTADAAGSFVTLVAGTGTTCGTIVQTFLGSGANNATDGWFLAASGGGMVKTAGGTPVVWGSTNGDDFCMFTGGKKTQISGHYVHQGFFDPRYWYLMLFWIPFMYWWRRRVTV